MSVNVYFAGMSCRKTEDNKLSKIERLCQHLGLENFIAKGDLTAIKLHFGEYGNDTHLNPTHVAKVVELVKAVGAKPFLTDTNTLYSGSRHNAIDHLHTAYSHGFSPSVVQAPVVIADGLYGDNDVAVPVNLKHFKETRIGADIVNADSMVVISHVKGHEMAGFGGAIKNLAMGCASVQGKRAQHNMKVEVDKEICIACGACMKVCPQKAISFVKDDGVKKALVNKEVCIGCFECITVCEPKAIAMETFGHEVDLTPFVERISEYAYGAVQSKQHKVVYINFVLNVTPDCDCVSWSDTPLVPDIGILASTDPVAIDQASYDLVRNAHSLTPAESHMENHGVGVDKFTARWSNTCGYTQISYGEEIGLGTTKYTLISV